MSWMKMLYQERRDIQSTVKSIQPQFPWQARLKAILLDEIDKCYDMREGRMANLPVEELMDRVYWLTCQLDIIHREACQQLHNWPEKQRR